MEQVSVSMISAVLRVRSVTDAQVKALAASIAEVGLLNPLTVYRTTIIRDGNEVDGFGLIAGAHRLEAVKQLGWTEVPAQIVEMDELHRTIAECDENLCGTQLTPAERAIFTSRRKWAYEQLHPETVRSATLKRGSDAPSRQVGETGKPSRFTKETAERTGKSERAVQRDAERGERVCLTALEMVNGTRLNTGEYIDKLKTLPTAAQINRVKADLSEKPKPVVHVLERISPLMRAWNAANEADRNELRALIAAEKRATA